MIANLLNDNHRFYRSQSNLCTNNCELQSKSTPGVMLSERKRDTDVFFILVINKYFPLFKFPGKTHLKQKVNTPDDADKKDSGIPNR